jgi:hypothetical protein
LPDRIVVADNRTAAFIDVRLRAVAVPRTLAKAFAKLGAARLDLGCGLATLCRIAAAVENGAVPVPVDVLDVVGTRSAFDPLNTLGAHLLAGFRAFLARLHAIFMCLRALGAALVALARRIAVVPLCRCWSEGGSR